MLNGPRQRSDRSMQSRMTSQCIWIVSALGLSLALAAGRTAGAWGPEGHQTIGAIADALLVGTDAAGQVTKLLGSEKLATAALWADCVKGVDDGVTHKYRLDARH